MKTKLMSGLAGLSLLASFSAASPALAEGSGFYVAPYLVYAQTQLQGVKAQTSYLGRTYERDLGDYDDGVLGGALALGYDFSRSLGAPVRLELEYVGTGEVDTEAQFSYRDRTREEVDLTFMGHAFFVNAYFDIPTGTAFRPYVGGGLGVSLLYSRMELRHGSWGSRTSGLKDYREVDANFAWNVGAGLAYQVNQHLTLDLGYRYASFGAADGKNEYGGWYTGQGTVDDAYQHQMMAGVRFHF